MSQKVEWSIEDWVKSLRDQAEYFRTYRHILYEKIDLKSKRKILDIGCGTGVITKDIAHLSGGDVTGIDIDEKKLSHAQTFVSDIPRVRLVKADTLNLPFKDGTFDAVMFCIVLIYVQDQQEAINEMVRVTKEGGIVLATMEPDYETMVHYPENPTLPLFHGTMRGFGADLQTGRKLRYLFNSAGLTTEIGLHMFNFDFMNGDRDREVDMFLRQFWLTERTLARNGWTPERINEYKKEQLHLVEQRLSFTFLPVYYAIGRKEG